GEEDGDTYEAPPCERPTIKVQRQPVEENVYLGYPERPQRQAAPPPRPAKISPKMRPPEPPPNQEEFYIDPNNRTFPEVNRKDKKVPPRKNPPAIPAPNLEEDVYLDPNEGQSGREPPREVYVEPTPARPPIPHGGARMVLPPLGRDPAPLM
ncbi:hypothetical protein NFI96_014144, partial [Prochilodus magdalenae]